MPRFRELKSRVRALLSDPSWRPRLAELEALPPGGLIGPLFALLLDRSEDVRWRAVAAFGPTMARLAAGDMEQARIVMRRFLWHMNEESGNLGWGIPEAMAESMAAVPRLADEFHKILGSYLLCLEGCDDNFLEHAPLRRGVYWGLGRLAQSRPELVRPFVPQLMEGLKEEDPTNRGRAAWTLRILHAPEAAQALQNLAEDPAEFSVFEGDRVEWKKVGRLKGRASSSDD